MHAKNVQSLLRGRLVRCTFGPVQTTRGFDLNVPLFSGTNRFVRCFGVLSTDSLSYPLWQVLRKDIRQSREKKPSSIPEEGTVPGCANSTAWDCSFPASGDFCRCPFYRTVQSNPAVFGQKTDLKFAQAAGGATRPFGTYIEPLPALVYFASDSEQRSSTIFATACAARGITCSSKSKKPL